MTSAVRGGATSFEFLGRIDALCRENIRGCRLTGKIAVGVRYPDGLAWWCASFAGTTMTSGFRPTLPRDIDAAICISHWDASMMLTRGREWMRRDALGARQLDHLRSERVTPFAAAIAASGSTRAFAACVVTGVARIGTQCRQPGTQRSWRATCRRGGRAVPLHHPTFVPEERGLTIRSFFDDLAPKALRTRAEFCRSIGGIYAFQICGEGSWFLDFDNARVGAGTSLAPMVVIRMKGKRTFEAWLGGRAFDARDVDVLGPTIALEALKLALSY
ncbi:MAG: hypothetical protein RIT81_32095 [Deltaproteobacteria bacterium]